MKNVGIVFTAPNVASVLELPMPSPKAGEVLVRLTRSALSSGTERANLIGVPDGGVGIFAKDDGTVTWPRHCGYSSVGVIEALGEGVEGLCVGDRVALSWSKYARYQVLPANRVYRLPETVTDASAAFTHIATFPMAAIRKCRLEFGESAMVIGQGVLGQLAVKILKAAGAVPLMAVDLKDEKRRQALKIGADCAFDPTAADFVERVKSSAADEGARMRGNVRNAGPRVVIEVTGSGKALDEALDVVAPYGRIALLGCTRDSHFSIDYYHKVHGRGVTLVGAHTLARPEGESAPGWWTERDDALAFVRMLAHGRISCDDLVEETHAVGDAPEVFGRLARSADFPTVQFAWE